jgi:hypothetical protein
VSIRIHGTRLLVLGALASGCATTAPYREPASHFADGVTQVTSAIAPYFSELNRSEARRQMLRALDDGKELGSQYLTPAFDTTMIRVRLRALAVVRGYATLLAAAVGDESGQEIRSAAGALKTQVASLEGTWSSSSGKALPDLSGPISSIARCAAELASEHRRRRALDIAISEGAEPVGALIRLIGVDAASALSVETSRASEVEATLLDLANRDSVGVTAGEKLYVVERILDRREELERLESLQIKAVFDEMAAAHEALVEIAKSKPKGKAVKPLLDRIEGFDTHAIQTAHILTSLPVRTP